VKLRVEHKHGFYVWQVFFPALLMTLTSVCPLAMPPQEDDMGDRLSVYGGGLLTLVAFKYAIAEHLPSVPYATFTDTYLRWQLVTVSFAAFESVLSFNVVLGGVEVAEEDAPMYYWNLDNTENTIFYGLCLIWCVYFLYAYLYMPSAKLDWRDVWAQKNQYCFDISYFEAGDPKDDSRDSTAMCPGVKLMVVKDSLAIWDVEAGESLDVLAVRQIVEATGPPESTDVHRRRFEPEDDQLCKKEDLVKRYAGKRTDVELDQYWNGACQARLMVPIKPSGSVEWKHVRVQDASDPDGAATITKMSL